MHRFSYRFLMSHVTWTHGHATTVVELPAPAMTSSDRPRSAVGRRAARRAQTTFRIALGILTLGSLAAPLVAAPPNRLWFEAWEIRAAGVSAEQLPVISELLPADPDVPLPHQVGVVRRDGAGGDAGLFVYDAPSTRYHLVAILHDDGGDAAPLITAMLAAIRDGGLPAAIHTYATHETAVRTSTPSTPADASTSTPSPDAACGCPPAHGSQAAPPIAPAPPRASDGPHLRAASGDRVPLPTAQPSTLTSGELTAGVLLAVALLAALVAVVRIVLLHREQMALLRTSLATSHPPPTP